MNVKPEPVRQEKRTAVVPIRFTTGEHKALTSTARNLGISLSQFVRTVACGRRLPKPAAPEINRRTYEELCRIGNNLNQLVRAVHSRMAEVVDLDLLVSLSRLVREVAIEALGAGSHPCKAEG
jgi:hypothetical protein